jgi:hypothetical protein
MDILDFAKLMNASTTGQTFGLDKNDLHREIVKRAEKSRRPGQSTQQSYRDVLLTPDGNELYRAYKRAPAAPPQDFVPTRDKPEPKGPAAVELDRLVEEFAARYNRTTTGRKLSRAQAYDRVFNDPENRRLRDAVRREEMEQTVRVQQLREPIWRAEQAFEADFRLGSSRGSARI